MTSRTIADRLRSMLGSDSAVMVDESGHPSVTPRTVDAMSLVLGTAAAEGWAVRIAGGAGWMPCDAPADLTVATAGLDEITHLDASDLVVTAGAGLSWAGLREKLAECGTWCAVDPPGENRTVGSVVATGTAGPLRAGFGAVRDQVLGLTMVTGKGHVIRPGGRVMKNVAGFDITKLATGSFGAFGVVTGVTLRLRAVPRTDSTVTARGSRDALLAAARSVLDSGLTPASLELLSPHAARGSEWQLAIRTAGPPAAQAAEREAVLRTAGITFTELQPEQAARLWHSVAVGATGHPTTLRLGAVPTALDDALDLLAHHLSESWVAVTVAAGTVRWAGDAPVSRLRQLRHAAAQQEMPVTLERAHWATRHELGLFGAYREGTARLVESLRHAFDPEEIFVTGLGARE